MRCCLPSLLLLLITACPAEPGSSRTAALPAAVPPGVGPGGGGASSPLYHGPGDGRPAPAAAVEQTAVVSRVTALAPAEAASPCHSVADCARVAADCCGFGGGGLCGAALRSQLDELQHLHAVHCADQVCIAATSNDPSCLGPLACQQGRCVVLAPAPGQGSGGVDIKPIGPAQSGR